jgi:acyl-CoA synthetase (AMP-forming)/AMP-acid ligase II
MFSRLRLALDRRVTVSDLLDELLRRGGGNRIVSIEDDFVTLDGAHEQVQRVADMHREVCALGRFLVEDAGLRRGGLVGIWRTNDVRCLRWFLAVIRAGGIAVPLNPLLSLPEVQGILGHCGLDVLVTDRAIFESRIGSRDHLPVPVWIQSDDEAGTLDGFLRVPRGRLGLPALPAALREPDALVAVFHTSGTEGTPKAAMLSSRALLGGRLFAAFLSLVLGDRDRALVALPWSHIMAVSTALYGLMAGVPGYCRSRFDAEDAIATIARHRITTVVGVPAMLSQIVNARPDPARLSSVRVWLSASDHLPTAVRARLLEYGALARLPGGRRIPPLLLDAYGLVEAGGIAAIGIHSRLIPGGGNWHIPVPPHRVTTLLEGGGRAPRGQVSECAIKGPGLTSGYWKDPATTERLFTRDGWLRTGDLGIRNACGFIRLVGRSKGIIKCGGYTVFASDVEDVMAAHPAVARAAVFGIPHPEKGEIPVAVVELHAGADVQDDDLIAWSRARLAAYKCPRRIHVLPTGAMPVGVTQKVLKDELRVQLARDRR